MKAVDLVHVVADNIADVLALPATRRGETDHRKHLYIWGLRRSGNHAIINWIEGMAADPERLVHFNDLSRFHNPWRRARQELLARPDKRRAFQLRRYALYRDAGPARARDEARGWHRPLDLVLFSFEDYAPHHAFSRYFRLLRNARYGRAASRLVVLILRDPFNLLASRIAHHRVHTGLRRSGVPWIDCWKAYARYMLAPPPGCVGVNFDRWVIDEAYRREIAAALGLNYNEDRLEEVSGIGGGSSFEGTRAPLDRQQLLGRWRDCPETNAMAALRSDPEIRRYVDALFEDIPGLPDRD